MLKVKELLKDIGLVDKEIQVYCALLPLGSASIRLLSQKTGINRGSVHDALIALEKKGLAASERRGSRRRFFIRSPEEILETLAVQKKHLDAIAKKVRQAMPTLLSFYVKHGGRAAVEYFDSDEGIRRILEDVLETVSNLPDRAYVLYSSKSVRSYLYKLFPNFTKEKTRRGIRTRVIALGDGGDPDNLKLAERRWLSTDAPAYTLVYGPKVALISVAEDDTPFGVLILDEKIANTQRILFEQLWSRLKNEHSLSPPAADSADAKFGKSLV